jgi:hypothetical protein
MMLCDSAVGHLVDGHQSARIMTFGIVVGQKGLVRHIRHLGICGCSTLKVEFGIPAEDRLCTPPTYTEPATPQQQLTI